MKLKRRKCFTILMKKYFKILKSKKGKALIKLLIAQKEKVENISIYNENKRSKFIKDRFLTKKLKFLNNLIFFFLFLFFIFFIIDY